MKEEKKVTQYTPLGETPSASSEIKKKLKNNKVKMKISKSQQVSLAEKWNELFPEYRFEV